MDFLDLNLELEAPELEALPDSQSAAGCVGSAGTFSSASCPASSLSSTSTAGSAG
ncbi:thiocillin family RiPP [Streptomyces sp. NPDC001941]|uniref:thiocillin family RiPP n=1 Tax=Streptomyces sp. NPDC001941 TaxID=3154659 RepID=UPI003329687E